MISEPNSSPNEITEIIIVTNRFHRTLSALHWSTTQIVPPPNSHYWLSRCCYVRLCRSNKRDSNKQSNVLKATQSHSVYTFQEKSTLECISTLLQDKRMNIKITRFTFKDTPYLSTSPNNPLVYCAKSH